MNRLPRLLSFAAFALLAATGARAQEWTGEGTVYGWLPAIEGEQDRDNGQPRIEITAKDILEALDFAFFASGEIRRDKFGLLFDMAYTRLSDDAELEEPISASAHVKNVLYYATAAASWRFYENDRRFAAAYGGFRAMGTEVDFDFTLGPVSRSPSVSANWVDPIIGLRGQVPLSERWTLSGFADVGGFGVGSELTWEAYAGANYAFNDRFSGVLGYRYMSIDYEGDSLTMDINLYGPLLGIQYRF